MKQVKLGLVVLIAAAAVALAGCAGDITAASSASRTSGQGQAPFTANGSTGSLVSSAQNDKGGKDDKGSKDDKSKDDKGKPAKDRPGKGNGKTPPGLSGKGNGKTPPGLSGKNDRGQGNAGKQKPEKSKSGQGDDGDVDGGTGQDYTGWQFGRFKDALPFAYPAGWEVETGRTGAVLRGEWDDRDYVVEVSRAMRAPAGSFEDWIEGELDKLDVAGEDVQYGTAGRVQVAVVSNVELEGYDCPVARAYLWTQNPAGRNQRAIEATVSQEEGEDCDPEALEEFVYTLASRALEGERAGVTATPSPASTVVAAPTGTPTRAGGVSSPWQEGRLGALALPVPGSWTVTNQGNTAVAQGQYEGQSYVIQVVPRTSIAQDSLQDWVENETAGWDMADDDIEYETVRGNDVVLIRGVDRADDLYRCPVTRAYVWQGSGGPGVQGVVITIAQMGLQPCNPDALNDFVDDLLSRAGR